MIINKNDPQSINLVLNSLLSGEIVVLPTDTVYGFSGLVPESDAKIRAIKGRSETKPFIQLIAKPSDVFAFTDCAFPFALEKYWPGALTVIVPLKKQLGDGSIAFRCPGDTWLRQVIEAADCPIYSTSVNRSGEAVLWKIEDIVRTFEAEVGLIVSDGDKQGLPSTLVNLSNGKCEIVRQGTVVL